MAIDAVLGPGRGSTSAEEAPNMSRVRIPYAVRWAATVVLAVASVTFFSPGLVQASDPADPDSFRSLDVGQGLVTLDVQDAPFGQVVAEVIQPQTRVNLIVSPQAAEQIVSLKVVDLHWVQALDALTERIGGVMVRKAQNLLRIERPEPVEIDFEDEEVKTVIQAIAGFAKASVIVTDKVEGQITVSLHGKPWLESLRRVVQVAGYALVEHDYGILTVVPRDELELDTDYHRFKYIRPPAPYKGIIAAQSGGSGGGGGESGGGGGGSGETGGDIVVGEPYVPTDDPAELEKQFPIIEALASDRRAGQRQRALHPLAEHDHLHGDRAEHRQGEVHGASARRRAAAGLHRHELHRHAQQ